MACLTCKIINELINPPGGIIHRDNRVLLCHNLDINIPGYVILSPLKHVTIWEQLDLQELNKLTAILHLTLQNLKQILLVDKIYICNFGEQTEHIHFHLFPRYDWMLNIKDAYTEGKFDGAKLFSYMRNKYKTSTDQVSSNKKVIEVVDNLRKFIVE